MNKKFISVCAIGLLCTYGIAQQKQEEQGVEQLDEVVVSDSRFELKRENSGKTVIKITQEEIQKNLGKTVAELINGKSGIEINGSRGNAGQNLGVYVRGGRNRQVLIMVDGVRVSDPSQNSGEYDFRLLSMGEIESIEIIKGAASTLYGNGAATAVISITTKSAANKAISLAVDSSLGTNQSQDDKDNNLSDFQNSVTINGAVNKFSYLAGFNQQYTNGLSSAITDTDEKDPFSKYATNLKLGYAFSDNFLLSVFGNYSDLKSAYDAGSFTDANNWFKAKQYRAGLSSEIKYENGGVYINGAYSKYDREFISNFPSEFKADNLVIDAYAKNTFNDNLHTILGVNIIDDKTEFAEEKKVTNVDPYANVVMVSDFGVNINAGARLNNHSEYGSHFTYNINPSYAFKYNGSYVKVFGSYGTSFIAPSLSQLFGFFGPNPDLKPEEDRTIEGGAEFSVGKNFRVSALYFSREEKNLIAYDFNQGYLNAADKLHAQGVEVDLTAIPVDNLSVSANYTFTERKEEVAIRIPKHKANAAVGYNFSPKTYASLNYQYTSNRLDTDFSTFSNVTLESFNLFDAFVSHQLNDSIKLFASLNNIFNEDYTEIYGFTTKGRNFRLGLSIRL